MTSFTPLNYVNVGPDGTFRPSGTLQTSPEDIDRIFEHLADAGIGKLAVHFHGGLVRESKGEEIARKMFAVYTDAGAHPVSFIWETGLLETVRRNILEIGQTDLFKLLLAHVREQLEKRSGIAPVRDPLAALPLEAGPETPEAARALEAGVQSAAAELGEDELERLRDEIELELTVELQGDARFAALAGDLSAAATRFDPAVAPRLEAVAAPAVSFKVARALAGVVYHVLKRFMQGRDHGLYPTIVEELGRAFYLADFGRWSWDRMKDAATEMWLPNTGPMDLNAHPGSYFLEKLEQHQQANPGFTFDIVGHSAGAIAICRMLRAMALSGSAVKIRNIVFLAPACTTRLFHQEIVSHPERFEAFRMFTMRDARETQDALVDGLYTRSLLYLISGALEDDRDCPLAGMERYLTRAKPYDASFLVETANWLLESGRLRAVFSVTEPDVGPGLASASIEHGDFDDDGLTQKSLKHIVGVA